MAQKTTAAITTDLATWTSDQLNANIGNTKPPLYPDTLNTVFAELENIISTINDSTYNKIDGLVISNISGLTSALANKETADPTILKQANLVNNLSDTSTTKPLTAAQGKVLKDLVDGIHSQNTDTSLATGTASAVTAIETRNHLDDSTIHYAASTIDHTVLINKGTNTHAQIDSHIANSAIHYAASTISHTVLQDKGTNTHAQIDTHIGASTAHGVTGQIVGTSDTQTLTNKTIDATSNTLSNIDHVNLLNKGTNTHAQIDTHIASTSNPHSTTLTQAVTAESLAKTKGNVYVANGTSLVAVGIGTNNQVLTADSAEAAGVKWADSAGEANTLASVGSGTSLAAAKSGTELRIKSINSANSRLTVSANTTDLTLTLDETAIVHQNLSGAGSNTHAQIDTHIASTSNPHSTTGTQVLTQEGFTFTKGRIYVADGTDLNSLAVGADGQVLKANSATTTGLEWSSDTGEVNTASNLTSSGVGVYDSKSSADLRFRRIDAADSKVSVALNGNKIDIGVVPSNISHQSLSGAGTNTHTQIDAHIANTSNPHSVTASQIGLTIPQTALTSALTSLTQAGTFTPDYAIQAFTNSSPYGFVTADEAETVLSVIRNLQTRVNELETKLQTAGIIS